MQSIVPPARYAGGSRLVKPTALLVTWLPACPLARLHARSLAHLLGWPGGRAAWRLCPSACPHARLANGLLSRPTCPDSGERLALNRRRQGVTACNSADWLRLSHCSKRLLRLTSPRIPDAPCLFGRRTLRQTRSCSNTLSQSATPTRRPHPPTHPAWTQAARQARVRENTGGRSGQHRRTQVQNCAQVDISYHMIYM